MRTLTFDDIDKEALLLYKYKRGSLAQGTFIEGKSDIDTCSVYLAPPDQLLGLGFDYQDEVSDEKHDNVAWEFNKFMRLLLKSNPTVLEALFVDDEFVDYEHPIITELKKSRDKFVTKACFNSFGAYAVSQIKKARALGKKCLNDNGKEVERRTALSFCYTYYNQGSTKIENWLSYRGLRTEFCGLNKIPNMHDDYGVFYDWGAHFEAVGYQAIDAVRYFKEKNREYASGEKYRDDEKYCLGRYLTEEYKYSYTSIDHSQLNRKPIGYRGIFKNDDSTEVRLSSIDDKNDKPICHMSFNQNGFVKHCKDYKDYKDWVKNRNPIRYAQNKEKNYDAKNLSHSFRLMNMCIEIAENNGFNVNRRNIDRDFLLDVKMHKYDYDEIIELLEEKKVEMDDAIAKSTLPDEIDVEFVNDFVIKIRKQQLGII